MLRDNAVVATKEVTLAGGAQQEVTFTIAKDAPGRYSLSVDSLSGVLVVKAPLIPFLPMLPLPADWWLVGGIVAAVIVVGVIVGFVMGRLVTL